MTPVRGPGTVEDTDYAFGRSSAEYERLIEQAEIFRPLTERMLRGAGISAGMHVLDIGCGAGDVSFLLSALVGAEGSVTGVDLDGDAIVLAEQRRVAQGIANVSFRQVDAPVRRFRTAVRRRVVLADARRRTRARPQAAGGVRASPGPRQRRVPSLGTVRPQHAPQDRRVRP